MDNSKGMTVFPSSSVPKQPQTFQFKIVGDILKECYERMLGYRILYLKTKDPKSGEEKTIIKKEKCFEPIVTEWGANRIITLMYQFINEQTPFSHLAGSTVLKMTNVFLHQLDADIYKNFEQYFLPEQRTITTWRLIMSTTGFTCLEILSRGIDGRESFMFYDGQKTGISIPYNPNPMGGK